jgi:hypothetical protein
METTSYEPTVTSPSPTNITNKSTLIASQKPGHPNLDSSFKISSFFNQSAILYHVAVSPISALLIDESINFAKEKHTSKLSLSDLRVLVR